MENKIIEQIYNIIQEAINKGEFVVSEGSFSTWLTENDHTKQKFICFEDGENQYKLAIEKLLG